MGKPGALSMLDCSRRSPIPVVFRCEVDMKLRPVWQTIRTGSGQVIVGTGRPAKIRQRLMPDDELIEFVCAENERSTQRFAK